MATNNMGTIYTITIGYMIISLSPNLGWHAYTPIELEVSLGKYKYDRVDLIGC